MNRKRIFILQKKAIRTINNSHYNAHPTSLFTSLKILPFEKIIDLNMYLFMHSIYNNYAHASFNNVWPKNDQRNHDHTLRNLTNFYIPLPRNEFFKSSPLYFLPKHWNNLPDEIKCLENRYTFKMSTIENTFRLLQAETLIPPTPNPPLISPRLLPMHWLWP